MTQFQEWNGYRAQPMSRLKTGSHLPAQFVVVSQFGLLLDARGLKSGYGSALLWSQSIENRQTIQAPIMAGRLMEPAATIFYSEVSTTHALTICTWQKRFPDR